MDRPAHAPMQSGRSGAKASFTHVRAPPSQRIQRSGNGIDPCQRLTGKRGRRCEDPERGRHLEHHANILNERWYPRASDWRDLLAVLLVLGLAVLVGAAARQMVGPLVIAQHAPIRRDVRPTASGCCASISNIS